MAQLKCLTQNDVHRIITSLSKRNLLNSSTRNKCAEVFAASLKAIFSGANASRLKLKLDFNALYA